MVDKMYYLVAVNSFWLMDMVHKFAMKFAEEKNKKKIKVFSAGDKKVLKKLQEIVDIEYIPSFLGGNN
jgi:hypothetical protein